MINYYTELSLDEMLSTEELRERIEIQRFQWEQRAARAGRGGEKAKSKLEVIAQALNVFANDDARDDYDIALLRARGTDAGEEVEIDWLDRAWSYLFMSEFGAAEIAARNARSTSDKSPSPFVVSAWIEIQLYECRVWDRESEQHLKNARRYVDEALVLDELAEDTAEVHHVRGKVFHLERDYDKAIRSYERALKTSTGAERAEIQWRIMLVQLDQHRVYDACKTAIQVLRASEVVSPSQLDTYIADSYRAIKAYGNGVSKCDELTALFDDELIPEKTKKRLLPQLSERREKLVISEWYQAEIEVKQRALDDIPPNKVADDLDWFTIAAIAIFGGPCVGVAIGLVAAIAEGFFGKAAFEALGYCALLVVLCVWGYCIWLTFAKLSDKRLNHKRSVLHADIQGFMEQKSDLEERLRSL